MLVSQSPLIAGVEIGGTKCIAILARSPDDVLEHVRLDTKDAATTLAEIDSVLERWDRDHGFAALGIASFGPLELRRDRPNYGSVVSTPKPGWSQVQLGERWRTFGVPIGFDIDVIAAARAEQRWGAAQGLTDFAYITVGTGLGVGPIIGDCSVNGRGHCEMGHMRAPRLPLDTWSGACPFHGDCVEGLASGAAIAARHGPGPIAPDWMGWASVEHALAMLVHNLLVSLQPQVVLLGGGVAAGRPQMVEAISNKARTSLADYYTAAELEQDWVRAPGLGTEAGPLGSIATGMSALGI